MPKKPSSPPSLDYGPLPVQSINKALGLELEPGSVRMSGNAQRHANTRHPKDFARLFPLVQSVVSNPLYIGDDGRNAGKIELVGRIPHLNERLLIAVQVTMDSEGNYPIVSFYPISETKIANRRASGHLKNAK